MKESCLPPARVRRRGQGTVPITRACFESHEHASNSREEWLFVDDCGSEIIDYPVIPVGPLGAPSHAVIPVLTAIYRTQRPRGYYEEGAVQAYAERIAERNVLAQVRHQMQRRVAGAEMVRLLAPSLSEEPNEGAGLAKRLVDQWIHQDPDAEHEIAIRLERQGIDIGMILAKAYIENLQTFAIVEAALDRAMRDEALILKGVQGLRAVRRTEELHEIKRTRAVSEARAAEEKRERARLLWNELHAPRE